ncbi:penicillin acylase family protein [Roseisolibacter agri]|uniref:Penicillin amidase n=1 Tax=Roseisolibacter agri TaxID=2014610 RepID=A0AA37Q9M6_9BACT|nr:penicillin acylase family protein [Roseisolibacter agri]GLC26252.1 penicillin amidase [Roseisolibacter agri]
MTTRSLRTTAAALGLLVATVAAARPVGSLPALGDFLDPTRGVWANARAHDAPPTLTIAGLAGPVRIVYDDRRVPHIFAGSEEDAYRALGYVVARDRLLQLHVQTLASSGRLTELAGERALALDREMRGLGMPRAAEAKLRAVGEDTPSGRVLRAYADGINAWIDGLTPARLPMEFKLLGVRPERWTPLHSLHVINRMGYTLAYDAPEIDRAAVAARVGVAAAAALFPERAPIVEPIQPNGQSAPRLDSTRLAPPGAPDPEAARLVATHDAFFPLRDRAIPPDERAHLASNNWAVASRRTAGGHALLAGDPHLELTLPSIWYEAHLVVPGKLDVYGVTIPGLPGVVIGFNRDVAWTFTNTGADVLDFFAEEVDDATRPTRYRVDGQWRAVEQRVETYRGKDGEIVEVDTLRFTHRGPLRRDTAFAAGGAPRWLSMRWTVLDPSDPLAAFREGSHATSARGFLDALAAGYFAPAQNMLAADRAGTIAIRSTGHYPIRAGDGSGYVVRDGRRSDNDWRGWIPVSRYPQAFDPPQGFLASANQQPIDPRATTDFWGGGYDPWRALRINALLRADSAVTPDVMRRWQTDPGSERANLFVPFFLGAAERVAAAGGANAARLREAARLLGEWDRRYTRESTRAALFEGAMRQLADRTWDELLAPRPRAGDGASTWPDGAASGRRVATPASAILATLLRDSASAWWDDRRTRDRVEDRDAILAASLLAAHDALVQRSGAPDAGGWTWSRQRHANINHLLRLPALSRLELPVQGGTGTLSPSFGNGTHGASWRMVVELGPEVRAWVTYPGGQSGDPADPGYTDRLPRWLAGELDEARAPRTPEELPAARRSPRLDLTLSPR